MIILGALLVGAALGVGVAHRHNGNTLDKLQYATGFGIMFTLLAVFITVIISRTLL